MKERPNHIKPILSVMAVILKEYWDAMKDFPI
jgi:hypothetical protein